VSPQDETNDAAGAAREEPLVFTAAGDEDGARLDVVVARHLDISRTSAQRLVTGGAVTLGGHTASKRTIVRAGDLIGCQPPPARPGALVPEPLDLHILFEDEWLLVVDKPAGVVVHPAPGHERGTLVQGLLTHGIAGGHERRPGIVHRLDRDTSGLLIVARDEGAHRRLVEQMGRREIGRTYIALLHGRLPQDSGIIDAPIGRHVRDRQRMSLHSAHARPAVTHFAVLARTKDYTLASVRLETGRTHQIRVHFAALGHPVVGDVHYGRRPRPEGLTRQFLHATRLTFRHPIDGRDLTFDSPLPEDLASFLTSVKPHDD
jgi:23S rRNA pseudouridine1911/1915/1917 synthase